MFPFTFVIVSLLVFFVLFAGPTFIASFLVFFVFFVGSSFVFSFFMFFVLFVGSTFIASFLVFFVFFVGSTFVFSFFMCFMLVMFLMLLMRKYCSSFIKLLFLWISIPIFRKFKPNILILFWTIRNYTSPFPPRWDIS